MLLKLNKDIVSIKSEIYVIFPYFGLYIEISEIDSIKLNVYEQNIPESTRYHM